ncbi:MAG: RsmE family RNA methyltransferase, partial [Moraxellaceae bacterium]
QVAIAACEQCGMNRVPQILAPLSLEQWFEQLKSHSANKSVVSHTVSQKLVLAPSQQAIRLDFKGSQSFDLLIGPEGGLSDAEIQLAQAYDFQCWTLGERILRTETAPVVALSALLFAYS